MCYNHNSIKLHFIKLYKRMTKFLKEQIYSPSKDCKSLILNRFSLENQIVRPLSPCRGRVS